MTLYLYPTDGLFLASVLALLTYFFRLRHDRQMRERWRQVLRTPVAGAAAVVIGVYFAIGILDSIHVANHAARDSLLDLILASPKAHLETSYSAPLAMFGFVKESVAGAGSVQRDYPRLRFGGRHLIEPSQRAADLVRRGALGVALGGMVWLALIALVNGWRRGALFAPQTLRASLGSGPLIALGLSCACVGVMGGLAPYYHIFGTDKVGTDVLYQALKGVRTGLVLCTLTTMVTLPLALMLGLAAGFCRGWIDDVIQYLYTTIAAIPGVLLIAAAALTLDLQLAHWTTAASTEFRADLKLLALCSVLGLTGWTSLCRLLRAEALKLRSVEFVLAAQALGVRGSTIVWRHLLPNTLHLVIIATVLDFSSLVLAEAVLTYIDIGVDPNMESWGNMINSARLDLAREPAVWWSLAAACTFMFVLVLAANLLADAVRDAFDPRTATSPNEHA